MDLIDRPRGLIKDFIYVKDKTLSKSFCDDVQVGHVMANSLTVCLKYIPLSSKFKN